MAVHPPGLRSVTTEAGLQRAIETLGSTPKECLLCSTPSPERAFHHRGKWFLRCRSCRLVFVHDIYPEFVTGFDETDYAGVIRGRADVAGRGRRRMKRVLAFLAGARQRNRLLEVGCGDGGFLEVARASGWDVTGLEILPQIASIAREKRGVDVLECDLIDASFPANEFDVVYMSEVIEHVVDPVELMQEVHHVLRPGGLAILRTGNAESWSAAWRGGRWWYYDFCAHGHIRFYGPRSARALAEATGFSGVESETRGFAFLESEELRGKWYKLPVKLAQASLSPLAGMLGRGHRLTMCFTK